jgi:hypothetical protein
MHGNFSPRWAISAQVAYGMSVTSCTKRLGNPARGSLARMVRQRYGIEPAITCLQHTTPFREVQGPVALIVSFDFKRFGQDIIAFSAGASISDEKIEKLSFVKSQRAGVVVQNRAAWCSLRICEVFRHDSRRRLWGRGNHRAPALDPLAAQARARRQSSHTALSELWVLKAVNKASSYRRLEAARVLFRFLNRDARDDVHVVSPERVQPNQ